MIEWISQAEMLVKFEEAVKEYGGIPEEFQANVRRVIQCLDQWPYEVGCIVFQDGRYKAVCLDISDELGEEMIYFDTLVESKGCRVLVEKITGETSTGYANNYEFAHPDFGSSVKAHLMRGVQALKDLKG